MLTTKEVELLNAWEVCPCHFCGASGKGIDFFLFGTEAHEKDISRDIIKMCMNCKNDWISSYMR